MGIFMFVRKEHCILGCLLIYSMILFGCSSKKEGPPKLPPVVTAFQVEKKTIPATFEFVGVAKSSHPVEIRARVEGYLWSIDYVEGSAVKIGQQLFQLDPRTYEASLEEAVGALAREEAILWRAQRSLDRMTPLFAKNAVSQRDLDDATAAVLTAEAGVLEATANLTQAELNLSYTKVTSPIDGFASRAVFREGTLITPNVNGLMTEVSVLDPIWVLFSIADKERLQGQSEQEKKELILPLQQEYEVQIELGNGSIFPYIGRVNFSSPILDQETGSLIVRATFPNPEGMVLPGQFVRALVSGATRPDAIFVPKQSVSRGQEGEYVFVVDANQVVSLRNVEVGEWYEDYWIIKQGLNAGEIVLVDGINKVASGDVVHIQLINKASEPKRVAP